MRLVVVEESTMERKTFDCSALPQLACISIYLQGLFPTATYVEYILVTAVKHVTGSPLLRLVKPGTDGLPYVEERFLGRACSNCEVLFLS